MSKEKLSIQKISDELVRKTNVSKKTADDFLKAFLTNIEADLLAGESVKINQLGTFKSSQVEARRSINVNTGEEMTIDGYVKISFTPDNSLKKLVNQPFEHLSPVEVSDDFEMKETADKKMAQLTENEVVEPLKHFENQANEIKDILNEIKNMSAKKNESTENKEVVKEIAEPIAQVEPVEIKDMKEAQEEIPNETISQTNQSLTASEPTASGEKKLTNEEKELDYYTEKERTYKFLWWLIPLLLIVCLLVLYFVIPDFKKTVNSFVCPNTESAFVADSTLREQNLAAITEDSLAVLADSLTADSFAAQQNDLQKDSVKPTAPTAAQPTENQFVNPASAPVLASVTIGEGQSMVNLAKKYYGHKDFWVYIYEANRDKIANPDQVSVGTVLKIPKLPQEMTDLSNAQALEKARELIKKYNRKPTR